MTTDDRISTTHGGGIERGRVAVHHESGVAIVTMQGEHALSTAPHISKALAEARRHSDVVVDLSSCSLIDSTVIGVLVATAADIRAGGENLVLAGPAGESAGAPAVQGTPPAENFPAPAP